MCFLLEFHGKNGNRGGNAYLSVARVEEKKNPKEIRNAPEKVLGGKRRHGCVHPKKNNEGKETINGTLKKKSGDRKK